MTGLYIHIPFCVHKCSYCDFVSYVADSSARNAYVDSLLAEIRLVAAMYPNRVIDTVFIGGGTPSILDHGEISRIIQQVRAEFDVSGYAEITIECNPGTLNSQKLAEYASCGINRLSIGLQSSSDRLLKAISRIHTKDDFLQSVELAKATGFTNINADVMYGLPTQSMAELADTLSLVCELDLTHISAYSLIAEQNTPLYIDLMHGLQKLPDEETEYAMHRHVIDALQKFGYDRYEISNYAKAGYECKHNLIYWNVDEYIGVGANAHSAIRTDDSLVRSSNYPTLNDYTNCLNERRLPTAFIEKVTGYEAMSEYIMLGLRKTAGFRLSDFERRFSQDFVTVFGERLKRISPDLYTLTSSLSLTDKGLDLQNTILCELI